MFDADTTTNTTMTFDFYYKQNGNNPDPFNPPDGTNVFYHSESFSCEVDTTQTNSQVETINGSTGLAYGEGDIMYIQYSGSPASEWGVIFYGYQR